MGKCIERELRFLTVSTHRVFEMMMSHQEHKKSVWTDSSVVKGTGCSSEALFLGSVGIAHTQFIDTHVSKTSIGINKSQKIGNSGCRIL